MSFSKRNSYICPFFFTKHELSEVGFICKNDKPNKEGEICTNAKTHKIIKSENEDDKMPASEVCDFCGEVSTTKSVLLVVQSFHILLVNMMYLIFAVIGAKEAGKSHYIAVLIDKIMNEVGAAFGCSLQAIDDATIKKI